MILTRSLLLSPPSFSLSFLLLLIHAHLSDQKYVIF